MRGRISEATPGISSAHSPRFSYELHFVPPAMSLHPLSASTIEAVPETAGRYIVTSVRERIEILIR
jgi:hypothetical protein